MELRQLTYFVALYEEGSVTRAARRLNIVQPAISTQIGKLEEELGQLLFQRTAKGMIPTNAGEEAYRLFKPTIETMRTAREQLASFGGRVAGHLSVGAIDSVIHNLMPDCLQRFCEQHSDVTLWVTTGYTPDLLEMLDKGLIDIAVINRPRHAILASISSILGEDMVLVCAPDNPSALPGPATLDAIAALPLLLPSRRHGLRVLIDQAFAEAGIRLAPQLEFDDLGTIGGFVEQSRFFSIQPPVAVRRMIVSGALKAVPIATPIRREIVCAFNPGRLPSRAAQRFVDQLSETATLSTAFTTHG